MQLPVPFVKNPNDRCVPASVGMILAYFLPNKQFTMPELEHLCAYRQGEGCWPMAHWLELTDMGFEIKVIEAFDLRDFSEDPVAYLKSILKDPEALAFQLVNTENLKKEAALSKEVLARGLYHENRPGTVEDIKTFLDDGWVVRLEVDAMTLARQPGYEGHSVLAIGYTDDEIILHNPDGRHGNRPEQHVAWPDFMEAWRNMGGSYSLNAYRLAP